MVNHELTFRERTIGGWTVPTVAFGSEPRPARSVLVQGTPKLDNQSNRQSGALLEWQRTIAAKVKAGRGRYRWNERREYAVSLILRLDRWREGDLDNFAKPILDAVAGGLFCRAETDPLTITNWRDFDDSGFRTLFLSRLAAYRLGQPEGVAIYVSRR